MQIPRCPHRWNVTPRQAIAIQLRLAPQVRIAVPDHDIRWVAGTDLAFTTDGTRCIAAAVLWDMVERTVVEQRIAIRPVTFPYVPGLLTFREAPAVLAALRKLRQTPDALMCDGQGRSHPRRMGLASHVGLLAGLPTIGCAKSRLTGTHEAPGVERGATALLLDKGEEIGLVVRTRANVKPLYVSVGHLIDPRTAMEIVLRCAIEHRLPEPTRLADRLVAQVKSARATAL